jgi:hypothetical protein
MALYYIAAMPAWRLLGDPIAPLFRGLSIN